MKIGDIVIAPEGCQNYLTAGKEYPVVDFWEEEQPNLGYHFIIKSDFGNIKCLEKKCSHLNDKDWILKPTTHEKVKDDKTIKK